jgi:threonine dehydrogenase-like Zn-dependent dehydrogenase
MIDKTKTETIRAWRMYAFGDMRLEDVGYKVPEGWVDLKVRVVEVSLTEATAFVGSISSDAPAVHRRMEQETGPQMFGHEYCGEVVSAPASSAFKPGDRVSARGKIRCGTCKLCLDGREDECDKGPIVGIQIPGAFAERLAVPPSALVHVADHISDTDAACIQSISSTLSCVKSADIRGGETVVMYGLGVMGLPACQFIKAMGAGKLIGVGRRKESCDAGVQMGCDVVLESQAADFEEQLAREAPDGIDVFFEAAGLTEMPGPEEVPGLELAGRVVKRRGQVIEVGTFAKPILLDTRLYRLKSIRYIFPNLTTGDTLQEAADAVADGTVTPGIMITHVLEGLESVPQAFDMSLRKGELGIVGPVQVRVSS